MATAKRRARPRRSAPTRASQTRTKTLARPAQLIAAPRLLPPSHPTMKKLGKQVVQLRANKERSYLERCLELGTLLRQARTQLSHGGWSTWLEKQVGWGERSANNYIRLSVWSEQESKKLDLWKTLGATKLFRIVSVTDSVRARLTKRSVSSLKRMSTREFNALMIRLADRKPEQDTNAQQRSVLRRSNRILRDVHALLERADTDPEVLGRVREVLLEAAEALHD